MNWTDIIWKCVYALILLALGNVLASWASGLARSALERTRLDPIVRRLLASLVRPTVLSVAILAAFYQLEIPMTPFAAMAGAITLAIGMALQGSLSNVASGAMLLSVRPFDAGDAVTVGGHTGTIQALHLFYTTVFTSDGQTVTLPNDTVWTSPIINFSDRPTRRVSLTWTVEVGVDVDQVAEIIHGALKDERILTEPEPGIFFDEQSPTGLPLTVRVHCANNNYGALKSDLQQTVLRALHHAKIPLATRAR